MFIPTIYSIIVLNIHTRRYDKIISNVSSANNINLIAKEEIPDELWDIVCGRNDFVRGRQYFMIAEIVSGIQEISKSVAEVNVSTENNKADLANLNKQVCTFKL